MGNGNTKHTKCLLPIIPIPCILNLETSQVVDLFPIHGLKCSNMEKGETGTPEDNLHIGVWFVYNKFF